MGVVRAMALSDPLALGFDARVGTHFLVSDFQLPAANEPFQDLNGIGGQVSAKESPGFELSFRVTNENPTNGNSRLSRTIPDRCPAGNFYLGGTFSIPVGHCHDLPIGLRVNQHFCQFGQLISFFFADGLWFSKCAQGRAQTTGHLNVIG